MKPVLILVDLQNDFLSAKGLLPSPGMVIGNSAILLDFCRHSNIPVVHVFTTVSPDPDSRMPHWKEQERWICVEGTSGHATPTELAPQDGEHVIHKHFFSAFSDGHLTRHLRAHSADTLIFAGLHLHACVRNSILDAYALGFQILVADDAVGSDDPIHAAITRRYLHDRSMIFKPVSRIIEKLTTKEKSPSLRDHPEREDPRVDQCVTHAALAGKALRHVPSGDRIAALLRLADILENHATPFARQMAEVIGKPVRYGKIEVERTASLVRAVASHASGATPSTSGSGYRRCPLGAIAVITPWNNPFLIPLGKISAAFAHANTVVWKPAPQSASIADTVMDCLRQADLPRHSVNLLHGNAQTARQLMVHPLTDAVTLTGGAQAGYSAVECCSRRHVPLQAELGGNNAAIIWKDADLGLAAPAIAEGAFGQAGQRCTANRRVIVHQDCYDAFLSALVTSAAKLPWGDPFDSDTTIGPMINNASRRAFSAILTRANAQGAEVLYPLGQVPPLAPHTHDHGAYQAPAIVVSPTHGSEIVQEESFGPILVVQKANDWEHAMELCNAVRQGLVSALFSSSPDLWQQFLNESKSGILKLNQSTADADVHLPFGGWKASGIGPPEHGAADIEFYTRIQTIYQS